jgi:hypothetical protein
MQHLTSLLGFGRLLKWKATVAWAAGKMLVMLRGDDVGLVKKMGGWSHWTLAEKALLSWGLAQMLKCAASCTTHQGTS